MTNLTDRLVALNDLLVNQGMPGNWDYDAYMVGMFNGMELSVAVMEGREANYRVLPEKISIKDEITSSKACNLHWKDMYGEAIRANADWDEVDLLKELATSMAKYKQMEAELIELKAEIAKDVSSGIRVDAVCVVRASRTMLEQAMEGRDILEREKISLKDKLVKAERALEMK